MTKQRRKQKNKNKSQKHSKDDFSAQRPARRRGPTIVIIMLVSLCVILLVGIILIAKRGEPSVSTQKNSPSVVEFGGLQPDSTSRLEPASGVQIRPVNRVDPLMGKSINATSPTTTYKGYIVAFCCTKSRAYNGGWNNMSESEKDAFVLKCLKGL